MIVIARSCLGRRSLSALLCTSGLAFAGSNLAQTMPGRVYSDTQYGYSFYLPADLVAKRQHSGELFLRSQDGHTQVTISSIGETRPGFPGNAPDSEGQATSADCDRLPPAYSLRKPNVVAFSCVKAQTIHYALIRYTASGSVIIDATYSVSGRAHWDPIIAKIASTLKRTR